MSLPEIFDTVETWVFDLDNTLYPAASHVFDQISRRMTAFIAEHFDIAPDAALARQKDYFRRYGTTLRGLIIKQTLEPGPGRGGGRGGGGAAGGADPERGRRGGRRPGRK